MEQKKETLIISSSEDSDCDVFVVNNQHESSSRATSDCLNPNCQSKLKPLARVPAFVKTYFGMHKKKKLKVCNDCFEQAISYYNVLEEILRNKGDLINGPYPTYQDVVTLDSDGDESSATDDEPINENNMKFLRDNLDVLSEVMEKYKIEEQCDTAILIAKQEIELLKDSHDEQNKKLSGLQKEIDEIRRTIYAPFQPVIEYKQSIEIIDESDDKVENQYSRDLNPESDFVDCSVLTSDSDSESNKIRENNTVEIIDDLSENEKSDNPDVVAVFEEVLKPPDSLPKPGLILRPKLREGDMVFAMRYTHEYSWRIATVTGIKSTSNDADKLYTVKFEAPKKEIVFKSLWGNHLAYPTKSIVQLDVGVRVIAIYRDERTHPLEVTRFYSGVIAEPPNYMNKFKYLVFFDDGYTQYIDHCDIRVICKPSANAWDDTPDESRDFIKKYLMDYPDRPMVRLHKGNNVQLEYKKKWWPVTVVDVNASLAKISFAADGREEWIYRGSTRLAPLFKEFANAQRRKTGDRVGRISTNPIQKSSDTPYVEYTHYIEIDEDSDDNVPNVPTSTNIERLPVARKSTARIKVPQVREKRKKWSPVTIPARLKVIEPVETISPKQYVAHKCRPACVQWTKYTKRLSDVSSLALPMYYGFRRIIYTYLQKKKAVAYIGPCGKKLRTIEEVHTYLTIVKSLMTVDMFEFDHTVDCMTEFIIEKCFVCIPDISFNQELHKISCVNYIDTELPNFSGYMTKRVPRKGVNLNLDSDFLSGCDCTDDCRDKDKCSCWQLTIKGQKLLPHNPVNKNIGYYYRKLPERVLTGIYECNSRCKCSCVTCLNRVVQHPTAQRLQLFKTEMKGWGIRCLNDIPQGGFICIYVGYLLTDTIANEEGKNYGDEYLAELDYIEVIERTKEGYESDVPEDLVEEASDGSKTDATESTEEEEEEEEMDVDSDWPCNTNSSTILEDIDNGIKSRLRKRTVHKKPVTVSAPMKLSKSTEVSEKSKGNKQEYKSVRKYFGPNESVYIMDARNSGNIGRYLNHSCNPNVFVQNVFVDTHDLRFPWVAFFALKHIPAGTELTWDYNYDIGGVENKIKYCYCGSQQCRGRLL